VDLSDRLKTGVIIVMGHALSTESNASRLSEQRAEAAEFELVEQGIHPRLIYSEARVEQPLPQALDGSNLRRVEVDFIGIHDKASRTLGASGMWDWDRTTRAGATQPPSRQRTLRHWATGTPMQFLPSIADSAKRARFVGKYQLVAVRAKDDALLTQLQGMGEPIDRSLNERAALLASTEGSPFAQATLAEALDRLTADEKANRELAQELWCDNRWSLTDASARVRPKLSQLIQALPRAQQQQWIECAAQRKDANAALAFLTMNRVDLNALNAKGSSSLHRVVKDFEPRGIKSLLMAGADPNVRDAQGRTPLHTLELATLGWNMGSPRKSDLKDAWDALVGSGANPLLQDNGGAVPRPIEP